MPSRAHAALLAQLAAVLMPSASRPLFRPATKGPKSAGVRAELKADAAAKRARRCARNRALAGGPHAD